MWKPQKAPGLGHTEAYERGHVAHLLDQRLELYAALSGLAEKLKVDKNDPEVKRVQYTAELALARCLFGPDDLRSGFIELGQAAYLAQKLQGCNGLNSRLRPRTVPDSARYAVYGALLGLHAALPGKFIPARHFRQLCADLDGFADWVRLNRVELGDAQSGREAVALWRARRQ